MKLLPLVLACTMLLVCTTRAHGDDLKKPDGFYEKNFVNNPPKADTPTPKPSSVPTKRPSESPAPEGTAPVATAAPTPSDDRAGTKVVSLSLVVSVADPKHFADHFKRLLELRERTHAAIKNVYLIGDTATLFKSPERRLLSEKNAGTVRYLRRMPGQFKEIKKSPAFLIETKAGTIVMEGFDDIEKGFNSKGEFVEPKAEQ